MASHITRSRGFETFAMIEYDSGVLEGEHNEKGMRILIDLQGRLALCSDFN